MLDPIVLEGELSLSFDRCEKCERGIEVCVDNDPFDWLLNEKLNPFVYKYVQTRSPLDITNYYGQVRITVEFLADDDASPQPAD